MIHETSYISYTPPIVYNTSALLGELDLIRKFAFAMMDSNTAAAIIIVQPVRNFKKRLVVNFSNTPIIYNNNVTTY